MNHHGTNKSLELRRVDLTGTDLQSTSAWRLLSCWLDFVYQPGLLALAERDGPPGKPVVETIVLEAPAARAPAPDTAPAPEPESTSAGRASPARRALDLSNARTPRPEQAAVHLSPERSALLSPLRAKAPLASQTPPLPHASRDDDADAATSPTGSPNANNSAPGADAEPSGRTRARISPAKSPTPSTPRQN